MPVPAIAAERFTTLMELIGRCLLRYQRIEHALKLLLPHVVRPGRDPAEQPANWRELLDSKQTLGPLMERFKEGLSSNNSEDVHTYLELVVEERNDLVHHFFPRSRSLSGAASALEEGISEVSRKLQNAAPLERMLISMIAEFAHELQYSLQEGADDEGGCAL